MLQASLSKFASQFNPSSGGQGDSAPMQAVASEPTADVASNYDDTPQGPEDQSEGEIIGSEGDPAVYLAKPESLEVPSRPPPAERTAEDQPFFHVPRNPEDPRSRVDISSGSASLSASQLIDQEAMSRKNAAAASTALSLAEYIVNYPGMPEGARAAMLLLKLDIVSCLHYAWREAHNKMLMRRSIALDCLRRTLPPIDADQKLALLQAPFKGTTLFGGELAKLQEANTKPSSPCFLSQQSPLHLIPLDRMSDEVGVSMTGRALRNLAGEAGDRAGPRLPPRVRNLASLKKARKL